MMRAIKREDGEARKNDKRSVKGAKLCRQIWRIVLEIQHTKEQLRPSFSDYMKDNL